MNLNQFLVQRKEEVKGRVPLSTLHVFQLDVPSFVDCASCDFIEYKDKPFTCRLSGAIIPERVLPLGCSKGFETLPF